jgi:hypothetical protein
LGSGVQLTCVVFLSPIWIIHRLAPRDLTVISESMVQQRVRRLFVSNFFVTKVVKLRVPLSAAATTVQSNVLKYIIVLCLLWMILQLHSHDLIFITKFFNLYQLDISSIFHIVVTLQGIWISQLKILSIFLYFNQLLKLIIHFPL